MIDVGKLKKVLAEKVAAMKKEEAQSLAQANAAFGAGKAFESVLAELVEMEKEGEAEPKG